MLEVNLFSVTSSDYEAYVGKCVSRARVDLDGLGVSVNEFIKGFLRDNLDILESALSNSALTNYLNSDSAMTNVDLASMNYLLRQVGYRLEAWNVADDEDNPKTVGAGTLEYNIINRNFLQHDLPTVTKLVPSSDQNVANVVSMIVEQSGLFDESRFSGVKNPFTILINNLKDEEGKVGVINPSIITKVYSLLNEMGFGIFCATSEE